MTPSYLDSDSVKEAVRLRRTWTRTVLWKPYISVILGLGQRYGSRTTPSYLDSDSVKEAVLLHRTAFCVAAPRVWNRLPADIRQLRSTQTFRRHFKTFLFAASY